VLDEPPPVHASRSAALASAVREALLNIEKHAQAHSVLVSVFRTREGVAVAVHDDGVGPPADDDRRGLGLAAATDRLARVGGYLTLGRNDDGGVTVQAWIPA
jgi:signal transduction histidine kinase